jgi:hypothetical protein
MEERVDAVRCGMEQMNTELCAVNAAVVSLQAKVNSANSAKAWLEGDINAFKAEIQRPTSQQTAIPVVMSQRKRKWTEEGSPVPEVVVNGGGRVVKGHGRKSSKVSNGLPTRQVMPSQCARE